MGCHLLEVWIPAVISALLLWGGVRCTSREYSLEIPSQVTVQDGLCVHIPCKFTYPESHDPRAQLYVYWHAKDKQNRRPRLVATNDPARIQKIDSRVRRRFEVSGPKLNSGDPKLNSGDCSLTINDAEAADQATYHFLMKKVHRCLSFYVAEERLSVIVTERKLNITIVEPLRAGQRGSIVCKYERCSSSEVIATSWIYRPHLSVLEHFQTENNNSVEEHMDFIPTVADHRRNVTCGITYGEGSSQQIVEKTVTLDIHYAPRILPFSGHLQAPGRDVRNFSNIPNGWIYAQADESLLVHCEADANPPGSQTWVRMPSRSSRLHISNNELKISGLRLEDMGRYECQARNQEGSIPASFYLHVQDDNDFIKGART